METQRYKLIEELKRELLDLNIPSSREELLKKRIEELERVSTCKKDKN